METIRLTPVDAVYAPDWAHFDRTPRKGQWWLRRCDEGSEELIRGILVDFLRMELTPEMMATREAFGMTSPEGFFLKRINEFEVGITSTYTPNMNVILTFTLFPQSGEIIIK